HAGDAYLTAGCDIDVAAKILRAAECVDATRGRDGHVAAADAQTAAAAVAAAAAHFDRSGHQDGPGAGQHHGAARGAARVDVAPDGDGAGHDREHRSWIVPAAA